MVLSKERREAGVQHRQRFSKARTTKAVDNCVAGLVGPYLPERTKSDDLMLEI